MKISETCSCGARAEYTGWNATRLIRTWRTDHRCQKPTEKEPQKAGTTAAAERAPRDRELTGEYPGWSNPITFGFQPNPREEHDAQ